MKIKMPGYSPAFWKIYCSVRCLFVQPTAPKFKIKIHNP